MSEKAPQISRDEYISASGISGEELVDDPKKAEYMARAGKIDRESAIIERRILGILLDRFTEDGDSGLLGRDAAKAILDLVLGEDGQSQSRRSLENELANRDIGSLKKEYAEGVKTHLTSAEMAEEIVGQRYEEAKKIEEELNDIK